jgi:hypothetical protein
VGEIAHQIVGLLSGVGWIWAGVISLVLAVVSLAVAAAIVVTWEPDRFKQKDHSGFWRHQHPLVRGLGLVGKNILGIVLILLGIIMSLPGVPGQGILVMVIGLTLVDFPGKRRLELWFVRRPTLHKGLNRLRARFHKPALELD